MADEFLALDLNHTTRRAPHMEKYVTVRKTSRSEGPWRIELNVGPQTFTIGDAYEDEKSALWMRDMVCVALDAICKDQE